MRARIVDNLFFGIYSEERLDQMKNDIQDGQLVSEWITVEVTEDEIGFLTGGYRYINQVWIAPEPVETVIEVPLSISKMKLRMQLILSGIPLASIYAAIEQIPNSVQKEIVFTKWEHAVTFDRTDETLNSMAQMLGMTQEQLDTIFIEGNKLQ